MGRWRSRRAACAAATAAALLACAPGPAAGAIAGRDATAADTGPGRSEAVVSGLAQASLSVDQELAVLVLLGAFPERARTEVAAPLSEQLAGASRPELLAELRRIDGGGPVVLEKIEALAGPQPEAVRAALGPLAPEDWQRLEEGLTIGATASGYVVAGELLTRQIVEADAAQATTTPPPAVAPGAPAGNEPAADAGSIPWATLTAVGGGIAVTAAVVAAGSAASRRRRRPTVSLPSPEEFGDVMEFLQRLAEASGVAGVGLLVASETRMLAGATGAALLTGRQMATVAGSDGDTDGLVHGEAVEAVVATAHPLRLVRSLALLYVPMVHRGHVVGVLAACRDASQPFTQAEQDRLVLLGPHLGSTLARAVEHDTTRELAFVDGLTHLANRRRLDHDLPRTLEGWLAAGQPVAFAMVDVDHFKAFNDAHGHLLGDEALRVVARVIGHNVRDQDVVYRYGGEEFSVLLPGATAAEAAAVAERVRAAVAEQAVVRSPDGTALRITVSVGVSEADSADSGRLIAAADGALYAAKHGGRNRVCTHDGRAR